MILLCSHGGAPGQFRSGRNPIAIGPGGTVYVADSPSPETGVLEPRIDSFRPSGALVGSSQGPALGPPRPPPPHPLRPPPSARSPSTSAVTPTLPTALASGSSSTT